MFLVDAAGRILNLNAAARVLLDRSVVFRVAGRRLIATDREAERAFADVFAAATNSDAARAPEVPHWRWRHMAASTT